MIKIVSIYLFKKGAFNVNWMDSHNNIYVFASYYRSS